MIMMLRTTHAWMRQAATLGFVPVYFFNYGMGYHNKKETKFSRQDQNMEFPMNNISQYEVKSDGTCEFHFRDGYRMPATTLFRINSSQV